jgi:hypothetical protein
VDRSTISRAIGELRPLLAERECTISPVVRLRTLAEVIDHLGPSGQTGIVDGTEIRVRRSAAGRRCAGDPPGRRTAAVLLDHGEVRDGVAVRLQRRGVQDVHQDGAALDVPQELQAEALALAGAGDEARDVGDGVDGRTGGDDAQVGHEGRERVVRDLRLRRGEHRDQRGLAGAWVADEGHVGDGSELQDDVPALPRLTEQREAGRLTAGGGQRGVAEAAAATLARDEGGALADQVGEDVPGLVEDDGAVRDGEHEVLAVLAGPVVTGAGLAVRGLAVGVVVVVDYEEDIAAAPAVAPVAAAQRLELLTVHGGHAVASVHPRRHASRRGPRRSSWWGLQILQKNAGMLGMSLDATRRGRTAPPVSGKAEIRPRKVLRRPAERCLAQAAVKAEQTQSADGPRWPVVTPT